MVYHFVQLGMDHSLKSYVLASGPGPFPPSGSFLHLPFIKVGQSVQIHILLVTLITKTTNKKYSFPYRREKKTIHNGTTVGLWKLLPRDASLATTTLSYKGLKQLGATNPNNNS